MNDSYSIFREVSVTVIVVATISLILLLRVAIRARYRSASAGVKPAMKARQDLLQIVERDLQYPINSVALCSSVLASTLEAPRPDIGFVLLNLRAIHRSAFRMNRLIENLLASTHIEAGQLQIRPQASDLRSLLNQFEHDVLPFLQEGSVDFVSFIGREIPSAFVDPDRLIQILSNIVGNAITADHASHRVVTVSVQETEGHIQFRIKDSGSGAQVREIPRIFEEAHEQQYQKSDALCLYISKALVEAQGGRIWIESEMKQGTTIYFTVPVAGSLNQLSSNARTLI